MNNFSEKFVAEMLSHGISQEDAARTADALSGIWRDADAITNEDIGDVKRIAASISAIILRRDISYSLTPNDFPDAVAPAETCGNLIEPPASPFFRKLYKSKKWARVLTSYSIPALLRIASIIFIAMSSVLIAASILAMAVTTIAGILLFLTGLIYGISQLNIFFGAGLYEIGFGIILGSLSATLTILLYNAVTKAIPFCASKLLRIISLQIDKFRRFRKSTALNKNGGKK